MDPQLTASICGWDQDRIVGLLSKTWDQEAAWRKSRDRSLLDGDGDDAGAGEHELVAWEQTTSLLRRALRVVVERVAGRDTSGGSAQLGSGR